MVVVTLWVLALFVVQTLLPASFRYLLAGPGTAARLRIALGPRDCQPPLSPAGGRAERALVNMQEAMPVFLGLALLLILRGAESELALRGAWTFLAARAVYVPAYIAGVFGARSLLWMVSLAGLVMMVAALIASL